MSVSQMVADNSWLLSVFACANRRSIDGEDRARLLGHVRAAGGALGNLA